MIWWFARRGVDWRTPTIGSFAHSFFLFFYRLFLDQISFLFFFGNLELTNICLWNRIEIVLLANYYDLFRDTRTWCLFLILIAAPDRSSNETQISEGAFVAIGFYAMCLTMQCLTLAPMCNGWKVKSFDWTQNRRESLRASKETESGFCTLDLCRCCGSIRWQHKCISNGFQCTHTSNQVRMSGALANRAFHCFQSYHSKSASNINGFACWSIKNTAQECKHLPKEQLNGEKTTTTTRKKKVWYRCCDENINVVFSFRLPRSCSFVRSISFFLFRCCCCCCCWFWCRCCTTNYLLLSKTIVITLNVPKCFGFNLPLFFDSCDSFNFIVHLTFSL